MKKMVEKGIAINKKIYHQRLCVEAALQNELKCIDEG
jgi:hypothetical protein